MTARDFDVDGGGPPQFQSHRAVMLHKLRQTKLRTSIRVDPVLRAVEVISSGRHVTPGRTCTARISPAAAASPKTHKGEPNLAIAPPPAKMRRRKARS